MENNVYEMLSKMMASGQNQGQTGGGNFNISSAQSGYNNTSVQSNNAYFQSQNPSFSYYPQEAYPNQENAPSASAMGFSPDNALPLLLQLLSSKGGSGGLLSLLGGGGNNLSSLLSSLGKKKEEDSSSPLPDDDIIL